MMAKQQPEFFFPFKSVQKAGIRRPFPPTAQSADPDTAKNSACVLQKIHFAFSDLFHVFCSMPVFYFMISQRIKDGHSFRHFPQKRQRIPVVPPMPVYQIPGKQNSVALCEDFHHISVWRAVQVRSNR
jgi:hypothetical protein